MKMEFSISNFKYYYNKTKFFNHGLSKKDIMIF